MKGKQRKPKTQTGFASFSMHELAEVITNTKRCCICKTMFIPSDKNGETRQCCPECIEVMQTL